MEATIHSIIKHNSWVDYNKITEIMNQLKIEGNYHTQTPKPNYLIWN